ncbi:hypothetical protein [Candidatus Nitrospira bockiana]
MRDAVFEQTICADQLWRGPLGDAIIKAFMERGRRQFAQAELAAANGAPTPAGGTVPNLVIASRLIRHSFVPTTRTGELDHFMAHLDIEMITSFQDATGRTLAEIPLRYSDQMNLWTPLLGSGGAQCSAGQLDAALRKAAEYLATKMAESAHRISQPSAPAQTAAAQVPVSQASPREGGGSALSVRATLLDENDNQILEAGEKVGVRIDATNQGSTPFPAASVVLSGTPALVDAFAGSMSTPLQVGPLQPGEAKSLILWGRMPANVEAQRGELMLSLAASNMANLPTQTLVAAIRPRSIATPGVATPASPHNKAATGSMVGSHYVIVTAIGRYRDTAAPATKMNDWDSLVSALEEGGIPQANTLTLVDDHATRIDMEEAVETWLPEKVAEDSIVIFYFTGQAAVDAKSGGVYLVPYDAGRSSSARRMVALTDLQQKLGKLPARLSLLLIEPTDVRALDGSVLPQAKAKAPNWQGELGSKSRGKARESRARVLQVVNTGHVADNSSPLLRVFQGRLDPDQDGTTTVAEFLRALPKSATVFPALPQTASELTLPIVSSPAQ